MSRYAKPGDLVTFETTAPAGLASVLRFRLVGTETTAYGPLNTGVAAVAGSPTLYRVTVAMPAADRYTPGWDQGGDPWFNDDQGDVVVTLPGPVLWAPTADDVAALMFARVTGEYGIVKLFTADTRPALSQVEISIADAVSVVQPQVGFDLDEIFHDSAKFLAKLYTALLLEPGYWPEQQGVDRTAWTEWKDLYDAGMTSLLKAIEEKGAGDEPGPQDDAQDPVWSFPSACGFDHVPGSEMPWDWC